MFALYCSKDKKITHLAQMLYHWYTINSSWQLFSDDITAKGCFFGQTSNRVLICNMTLEGSVSNSYILCASVFFNSFMEQGFYLPVSFKYESVHINRSAGLYWDIKGAPEIRRSRFVIAAAGLWTIAPFPPSHMDHLGDLFMEAIPASGPEHIQAIHASFV